MALSGEIGTSASEIMEASYSIISAGADTANAMELVEASIKAARGGFTHTKTAVDKLMPALNAYDLAATESKKGCE